MSKVSIDFNRLTISVIEKLQEVGSEPPKDLCIFLTPSVLSPLEFAINRGFFVRYGGHTRKLRTRQPGVEFDYEPGSQAARAEPSAISALEDQLTLELAYEFDNKKECLT